ncbi:MAG: YbhN family protein [Promethearchaeota archaeon]
MVFMILIVDFRSLLLKISLIGINGTLLFIIAYTSAFLFRSAKLKLIFKGLKHKIMFQTAYFTTGICFIVNDITPGKFGELAKIVVIRDQEKLHLSESVCGITIERVLDLVLLFIISCLAFFYLYINSYNENSAMIILGQNLQLYLALGAIIITTILMVLFLLISKTDVLLKIIGKFWIKLADLLGKFIYNFKDGMKTFKKNQKELIYVLLLGFITWLIDALIIVIFFYYLGYKINIIVLLLAVILVFFSKTFPITPGGWGISENIGALFIFVFYPQIPFIEILAIFIIDHLFRSAYILFYGGYSIFHYNFKLKETRDIKL